MVFFPSTLDQRRSPLHRLLPPMLLRFAIVTLIYLALYAACWVGAFGLRLEFQPSEKMVALMLSTLPAVLAVKSAIWLMMRQWRRRHRYTTLRDMASIAVGTCAAIAALEACNRLFAVGAPRSVILIDAMLSFLAAGLLRAGVRVWADRLRFVGRKQRALILGTDSEAVGLLRSLQLGGTEYHAVGLISPVPRGTNQRSGSGYVIAGTPVFGLDALESAARRLRVEHLFIPAGCPGRRMRRLVRRCRELGLQPHVVPSVVEILAGRYQLSECKVTISDLLRRDPTELDFEQIRGYVSGKRVLVTGGAGSIGSEICRQVLRLSPQSLIIFDQSEYGVFAIEQELNTGSRLQVPGFRPQVSQSRPGNREANCTVHYVVGDILDRRALERVMRQHRPHLVFHAAAYKHVPLMESNPHEAIRNNLFGTKNVIDAADRHDVETLVLISTDKAVRPTNVMGSTKLLAEKYLQSVAARSSVRLVTVRFGNVLNSMGSVVPTFQKQIERGGPITVTHPEMQRYFMTIPEAVQLVLQAGAVGRSGDLLLLDMGEPVKIVDLARDLIHLSGRKCPDDIDIVFTGLRPGEKLYEELLYECESSLHKVRDGIILAGREPIDSVQIGMDLERLKAALDHDAGNAADVLREIVAKYVATDNRPQPTSIAA